MTYKYKNEMMIFMKHCFSFYNDHLYALTLRDIIQIFDYLLILYDDDDVFNHNYINIDMKYDELLYNIIEGKEETCTMVLDTRFNKLSKWKSEYIKNRISKNDLLNLFDELIDNICIQGIFFHIIMKDIHIH